MDWSSIYDEHGEEEGDWSGWASGRLAPVLDSFSRTGDYTPLICYFFTINYILGVGCLGIPYAFYQSGIILGTLLIVCLSGVAYITVSWVAETGHRDIQLRKYGRQQSPYMYTARYRKNSDYSCEKQLTLRCRGYSEIGSPGQTNVTELTALAKPSDCISNYSTPVKHLSDEKDNTVSHFEEESEVLELVLRFLGPYGKTFYQSALMMLMFVGLIAYTQVFVSTFSSQIWSGLPPVVPSIIFGALAVPLSCVDLAEQISIQVLMSILRFVSLAILLLGTLAAMSLDPEENGYATTQDSHVPLFKGSGFGLMFTTAIFSQLFQHSVPGLIRPLHQHDRVHVATIFGSALITTGVIYILTGIACVVYFGPIINQAINLNFVGFDWGAGHVPIVSQILIRLMAMTVVLFPALDTVSVFPLIANTLGNNFHAAFPKAYKRVSRVLSCMPTSVVRFLDRFISGDSAYQGSSTNHCSKVLTVRLWRLVAALPPIILSVFITDLSLTLQLAGVCGILVALVTPALLQQFSLEQLYDISDGVTELFVEKNPYCGFFSSVRYTYGVLLLAGIALVICVFQIIGSLVPLQ